MVTSSVVPIKPFPLPPTHEPTLEVAEFPSLRVDDAFPHMSYVNHLYVYPRSLKYDAQKTFHRARNISCVVELRDNDAKDAKPIKVLNIISINPHKFSIYLFFIAVYLWIHGKVEDDVAMD